MGHLKKPASGCLMPVIEIEQISEEHAPKREVRFAPINGHRQYDGVCPLCADFVEKLGC